MKAPQKILSILLVLSSFFLLKGQNEVYSFEQISVEDGLSQSLVFDILQDFRGFLWVATADGVNRYDGIEFTTYYHKAKDSLTPFRNHSSALFEDGNHRLWLGAGGLNLYCRQLDRFIRVLPPSAFPKNETKDHIIDIVQDHNGDLWVAIRDAGLYRIRGLIDDSLSLQQIHNISATLEVDGPYPYYTDSYQNFSIINQLLAVHGEIWISHYYGVSRIFPKPDGQFAQPTETLLEQISLPVSDTTLIGGLLEGTKNSVWVGTSDGLVQVPQAKEVGKPHLFPYGPQKSNAQWFLIGKDLISRPDGTIWVATYDGIEIFDPKSKSYTRLQHEPGNEQSIAHNNITKLYTDRSEVLWVGTSGMGLSKLPGNRKPFHQLSIESSEDVFSTYDFIIDPNGIFWIAHNDNVLSRFQRSNTGQLELINHLPFKGVFSVTIDEKGYIWIVATNEILKLDTLGNVLQSLDFFPKDPLLLQNDSIPTLFIDEENQLWACNSSKLCLISASEGIKEIMDISRFNLGYVSSLLKDGESNIWIGGDNGMVKLNTHSGNYTVFGSNVSDSKYYLHNEHIQCLYLDSNYLWLGSGGGGLYRLNLSTESLTVFDKSSGLSNNYISGILNDSSGNIWVSTHRGINKFDTKREEFLAFSRRKDISNNEFNVRSYYKTHDQKLIFGGVGGLTFFDPLQVKRSVYQPPVMLTELFLSYQAVDITEPESPLSQSISESDALHLSFQQNSIAFEFAALDFNAPDKNQFRYQLEGFDDSWIQSGNINRASYTKLPFGQYTFRVQGSNSDGLYSEDEVELAISIAPPPWLKWWAVLSYLLIIGWLSYLIIKYTKTRRKLQLQIKQQELEKQNAQELANVKSRFFTNVSHELRTPLTLIKGRLAELKKDLVQSPELIQKIQSADRNTQQVHRYINQILDIAKLESKDYPVQPGSGDIIRFTQELVENLQFLGDKSQIKLNFKAHKEKCYVIFDGDILEKIFQNLIQNAIKYSPQGGTIEISLDCIEVEHSPSDVLILKVKDEGPGISDVDQKRVFDPFYQIASNSEHQSGFGLGLPIVKELTQLLGGRVSIKSKEQEGSTFIVEIPLVRFQALNESQVTERYKETYSSTTDHALSQQNDISVLIAEDHAELRDHLNNILKSKFNVLLTKDGIEAWEMAREFIPDIIISDVVMPKFDGFELASKLLQEPLTSHIPILFLTAKTGQEDRLKALKLGVDDYIHKPFESTELVARVHNLIRRRQELKEYHKNWLSKHSHEIEKEKITPELSFLTKVQECIATHLHNADFSVEKLAEEMNMSSSSLYRKLQALADLSPVQFIREQRLIKAKEMLREDINISEVAYQTGFNSPSYFSKIFKEAFRISPKEYKKAQSS